MLSPSEFSVGCISDAAGLTLLLPRGKYQHRFLITLVPGTPTAIFLDGEHAFHGFDCTNNTSWHGILVPSIRIEVDEKSLLDLDEFSAPLGALVRVGTQLTIIVRQENMSSRHRRIPIQEALPPARDGYVAGFTKWAVVIGEGRARRELTTVDVSAREV